MLSINTSASDHSNTNESLIFVSVSGIANAQIKGWSQAQEAVPNKTAGSLENWRW
jgi:hypothetical protein